MKVINSSKIPSTYVWALAISSFFSLPCMGTDFDPAVAPMSPEEVDTRDSIHLMEAISRRTDLSTDAKNISVESENGSTTLRGLVKDDREKQIVGSLASQIMSGTIKNELSLKRKNAPQRHIRKPLLLNTLTHKPKR